MHSRTAVIVDGDARGTVTCARGIAAEAGLRMYGQGGNAVDAAVAAALVAGVVEPTETTLAGSGFLLVHDPDDGPWSLEFGPRAPKAAHPTMFTPAASGNAGVVALSPTEGMRNLDGPLANGVPRALLGLLTAQDRWGRLGRSAVLAPAIAAAYEGFAADTWFVTSALSDLTRLRRDPQSAATFLADGLPIGSLGASDLGLSGGQRARVTQPLLGRTLEIAAGSPSALVDGETARALVATARELGGLLTMEDLGAAGPRLERPRTLGFRGHEIHVPVAPNGGPTVLEILALWQTLYRSADPDPMSERVRRLALVIRHAFADRYHWLGDPDHVPVPADALLDPAYLDQLAARCRTDEDVPAWHDGLPWTTYAGLAVHDPWRYAGCPGPTWTARGASTPTSGTTHVCAADADGRTVSITHTAAHHFGSGVVCPRTGLLFDAAMAWFNAVPGAANSIAAGKRPLANMAPTLVSRDGRGYAALGASGGRRIVSSVVQLVLELTARPADEHPDAVVTATLAAPRIDASGPVVELADGLAAALPAVRDLGARIVPATNDPFVMDFARPNLALVRAPHSPTSGIPASGRST